VAIVLNGNMLEHANFSFKIIFYLRLSHLHYFYCRSLPSITCKPCVKSPSMKSTLFSQSLLKISTFSVKCLSICPEPNEKLISACIICLEHLPLFGYLNFPESINGTECAGREAKMSRPNLDHST